MPTATFEISARCRKPDAAGRYAPEEQSTRELVTVEVDLRMIAALYGQGAVENKSGVSRQMGGAVVIRHHREKKPGKT